MYEKSIDNLDAIQFYFRFQESDLDDIHFDQQYVTTQPQSIVSSNCIVDNVI